MKIYGTLRLRPTRIGFLVRPNDLASVRRIMRICVCMWGGMYNPIIPVARRLPISWRQELRRNTTSAELADGFLRFFEPDVFVEATAGLAAEIGIKEDKSRLLQERVLPLDSLSKMNERGEHEFPVGLNVFDLYRYLYEREYQFVPRHKRRIAIVERGTRNACFYEAAFGAFPVDKELGYIEKAYQDAFDPIPLTPNLESWLKIHKEQLIGPLRVANEHIDRAPIGHDDPIVFIFDPDVAIDVIDLWNLRQFRQDVLPVHVGWLGEIAEHLKKLVKRNYHPLPGNPHGVMIRTTIEFARSIGKKRAEALAVEHLTGLPVGSWSQKAWYDPIWLDSRDDMIWRPRRARVTARSTNLEFSLEKNDLSLSFEVLAPDFAERFGGAARWANVLSLRDFGRSYDLALSLPTNIKTLDFPRLGWGEPLLVSSEGFVALPRYTEGREHLRLTRGSEALIGWFQTHDIKANPSEAGRIADQVIAAIGSLWRAGILADSETLKLLDKMAKSVRIRPDGSGGQTVEEYSERTASVQEWKSLIHRRAKRRPLERAELSNFVDAGVLRLGLVAKCTNCGKDNWYGLGEVDYRNRCERCLNEFDFPQGTMDLANDAPWRYRVIGPFAVPNLAAGGYATALTLRVFSHGLGVGDRSLTYATGLDLEVDQTRLEIDFAFWFRRDRPLEDSEEPVLVLGESKGFAEEAFQAKDIERLRALAMRLPGTCLVFSTLKDRLSELEQKSMRQLALWGRVPLRDGRPRCPVIVLTETELFFSWDVKRHWEQKGGLLAQVAKNFHPRLDNLWSLADITQRAYLDLNSHSEWLQTYYKKKTPRAIRRV